MAMLFKAQDLLPGEKLILRCYFNITQSIAGCQAIKRRIGHCLFGFRVVYGECIFVTVFSKSTLVSSFDANVSYTKK